MYESEALTRVKGVGKKTEQLFQNMGVYTLGDILSYFPRNYERYPLPTTELEDKTGEYIAIEGIFFTKPLSRHFRGLSVTSAKFTGHDVELEAVWFRMPYLANSIQTHMPYVLYGRLNKKGTGFRIEQPKLFEPTAYVRLTKTPQPIYSLTKGLSNKTVSKVCKEALNLCLPVSDNLPSEIKNDRHLPDRSAAFRSIHFPESEEDLKKAGRRFTYEEFLAFFLGQTLHQRQEAKYKNQFQIEKTDLMNQVKENLPFALTDGQESALRDVLRDFHEEHVSERLIQGDVGSGKTILAFLCMLAMAENGYQAALMAPTEVLASQHLSTILNLIEKYRLPFQAVLLTGSVTAKERKSMNAAIASGDAKFIIGTHALIQDAVEYQNLGLVVTDEQHRFGVKQRMSFAEKGQHPFSLVMSATPIPRTLALILYQGMKVSVIRDVPSTRLKIKTAVLEEKDRKSGWRFIYKEVMAGHQAYIICPLVEESENSAGENVTDYAENFRKVSKGTMSIASLHGRMKADEKNRVMKDFAAGKIQVLVSTTVVEVGVNVPNATVMMIENADRFGLSQLHQLRGRVGRGQDQSYCILVNSSSNDRSKERLNVIKDHNSGFDIAERDLEMRGPGDVSGVRQSGDLPFIFADLYTDHEVMNAASEDANRVLDQDPDLILEENAGLRRLAENGLSEIYTNL